VHGYQAAITVDKQGAILAINDFFGGIKSSSKAISLIASYQEKKTSPSILMKDYRIVKINSNYAQSTFDQLKNSEQNNSDYFQSGSSEVIGKLSDNQLTFINNFFRTSLPLYVNQFVFPFDGKNKQKLFEEATLSDRAKIESFTRSNFTKDTRKQIIKILSELLLKKDDKKPEINFNQLFSYQKGKSFYDNEAAGETSDGSLGLVTVDDSKNTLFKYHAYHFASGLADTSNNYD
jgi:hypothetical protein